MTKQKSRALILAGGVVLGLVWAFTTGQLPVPSPGLDLLINISSLFTVASFSVRGMLALRSLAVASQAVAIPYFMLQPTPLWTPVAWTVLFLAINLFHITRILLERRPVKFSPEEKTLYEMAFQRFEPREFLKLLGLGEWRDAKQGDRVMSQGQPIGQITVPISGTVSASQDDRVIAQLHPGELIGAGMALTKQQSMFSADFTEGGRYMCWSMSRIEEFLDKNPDLALKFDEVVSRYLVAQINKLALNVR